MAAITLDGVNTELRQRIEWVLANSAGSSLKVSSAFRSPVEQQVLYNRYVKSGFNPALLAARPGTSNHERGLAVDVECAVQDNKLRADLFKKAGLHTPVKGELWHAELAPNRKALPTSEVASQGVSELEQPTLVVDVIDAPEGGTWRLQRDGGVLTAHGSPFLGSYPGLKPEQRQGARYFVRIKANGIYSADGYTCYASDGNKFSFPLR